MRVMLAAIRCEKGDIDGNRAIHLGHLADAASRGCDLAVFPEMSLTGSVDPGARPEHLVSLDHRAVSLVARATGEFGVAACFGVAERSSGGDAHITQVFAAGGRIVGVQRKRHLGEGEGSFTAVGRSEVFELAGVRFGVAICLEAGFDDPFDAAVAAGARLILFPAAPGLYGRRSDEASWREGFSWWEVCSLGDARRQASRLGIWIALAGQAGATVDEDFPGLAALVSPAASVVDQLPDWNDGTLTVNVPL